MSSGAVAPETSSLLGLLCRFAPPLVTGNTVVLIASERRPLPAVSLAEVLATSDVLGGAVNILTGRKPVLCQCWLRTRDVDALDTWGVPRRPAGRGSNNSPPRDAKRLLRRPTKMSRGRASTTLDDAASERPERIAAFLEMKTVWHPIGG